MHTLDLALDAVKLAATLANRDRKPYAIVSYGTRFAVTEFERAEKNGWDVLEVCSPDRS